MRDRVELRPGAPGEEDPGPLAGKGAGHLTADDGGQTSHPAVMPGRFYRASRLGTDLTGF